MTLLPSLSRIARSAPLRRLTTPTPFPPHATPQPLSRPQAPSATSPIHPSLPAKPLSATEARPSTPTVKSSSTNQPATPAPQPTPPPNQHQQLAMTYSQFPDVGNQLTELPLETLPPQLKREGDDCYNAVEGLRTHRFGDEFRVGSLGGSYSFDSINIKVLISALR